MAKVERGAGRGKRVLLRCACGHTILCEVHPEGEYMGLLIFLDGEQKSEDNDGRVKNCPGCGRRLGLPVLYRENRPL